MVVALSSGVSGFASYHDESPRTQCPKYDFKLPKFGEMTQWEELYWGYIYPYMFWLYLYCQYMPDQCYSTDDGTRRSLGVANPKLPRQLQGSRRRRLSYASGELGLDLTPE